jgi:hypothetical protein
MKKKVLILGTCRVLPQHSYVSSNAGFFYEIDHDHNFEYHTRPYGQCVSLHQLHMELHDNYHESTYHNKNINSYINKSLRFESKFIHKKIINKEPNIIPYNNYDGYIFEISSFKFITKNNTILAPDIATTPDNIDKNQIVYKNADEEKLLNLLEEINILLEGKPILFVLPFKSIIPERYKMYEIMLKFCSKYNHICLFDPDNIIYSIGYSNVFVKLSEKKSKLKKKIHNRNIVQKKIPYMNIMDETEYDITHFTNKYREEIIKYYKYFFDLFL